MENYLDLLENYSKIKNNLICFNSYSNDVRLLKNHIIKNFNNQERLEKCIVGLQIMRDTIINVPKIEYVCREKNIIVENYIDAISMNEFIMKLNNKNLYDIGKLMANFHNINISSKSNENEWVVSILADMINIREILSPYENDFNESISFVENESKYIFKDLHFTYVHGDFRPANILYDQTEEKYYLIDFENFMIGDPMLDIYKMLSVLKNDPNYNFEDVRSFLDGYQFIKKLPDKLIDKWFFYDVYYSLRSVRRAINDKKFRKTDDQYIINADMSAQRKNMQTVKMSNWLEKYLTIL